MMSRVLTVSGADVRRLLPMAECISLMEGAFRKLGRGNAVQPLRSVLRAPRAPGLLGLMPGWLDGMYGVKTISVFPENPARGLDAHQGAVLLFDGTNGELRAVVDASAITEIRTAAVTALATRLLARADSRRVAIIGAGRQARAHGEAMLTLSDAFDIEIVGRSAARSEELASSFARASVRAGGDVESAVRTADIVVTVTNSSDPVLRRDWIQPGAHLNLVGASVPTAREADSETIAAGALFVDRRESALHESGDVLVPLRDGVITEEHIRGELGEVLVGTVGGRSSAGEITIFKSLGLAVEDIAAARHAYEKARAVRAGVWIEL